MIPLLCRILGHKWRLPRGFYTIGEKVRYDCARKGCTMSCETDFYVERF